jgi:CRISPR-associated protein Cmr1
MPEPRLPICSFELRTVTPLFLGGSHPDACAELRPPTLKGLLRDWFRVLVGTQRAAREEGALFGSAAAGAGQSPFLLAIDRPLTGTESWQPPTVQRNEISGLNYLGYSLNLVHNRRKAIPAGRPFRLEAVFPRGASEDQRRALFATLWLLAHLGGAGSRSRRGFGSLALERWIPEEDADLKRLPLLATLTDRSAAIAALGAGLAVVRRWFSPERANTPEPSALPGFTLARARLLMLKGPNPRGAWSQPLAALESVGAALQRFRRQPGIDGFSTSRLLASRQRLPHAPGRTSFGLPLTYRTRESGSHTFEAYLPDSTTRSSQGNEYARFPSPLLLHIQAIDRGFLPVVTLLAGAGPARPLPVRERRGRGYLSADPANDLPERFLQTLLSEGASEVGS